jgi:hypothetical protein
MASVQYPAQMNGGYRCEECGRPIWGRGVFNTADVRAYHVECAPAAVMQAPATAPLTVDPRPRPWSLYDQMELPL